jgi:hypothetical protein
MDWGSSKKAQLQMMISMKRDAVDYSPSYMGVIYFSTIICGLELKRSKWNMDFYST